MKTIFIFRRDLRLDDNIAMNKIRQGQVMPIFILNPKQIDPKKNPYYSENSFGFMIESLIDLDQQIKKASGGKARLVVYKSADDTKVLSKLKRKFKITHVAFNRDITPFARKRDDKIEKWCKQNKVELVTDNVEDYVLISPHASKPYQVFNPYYKKLHKKWKMPAPYKGRKLLHSFEKGIALKDVVKNKQVMVHGGRELGLKILRGIGKFRGYAKTRDDVGLEDGTTHLSAYLKYGCVSVREAAAAAKRNAALLREMMWRCFYDQVIWHFPHTLEGQVGKGKNKSLKTKYDKVKWSNNARLIKLWKTGKTGIPIVDAGMRQLNQTGYMHNRLRMIVASVLIKDFKVDWRIGEKYFASRLVDYYPSANNQGWTWVSGGGANAQPSFQKFNPWLQAKKHDKQCKYIKRWVPELKDLDARVIHGWDKYWKDHKGLKYPKPVM